VGRMNVFPWIPAFAGMTRGAGMTGEAGMHVEVSVS
jgi:hypothetical protein